MKHFLLILSICIAFLMPFSAVSESNFHKIGTHFQEALAHADQGKTPWQTFPEGEIRLISCRSGVQGLDGLMTGIEIRMKSGWQLLHPDFQIIADSWDSELHVPFRTDIGAEQSWTKGYVDHVIFPVWLRATSPEKTVLSVIYNLDFFHPEDQISRQETGALSLPLPNDEAYPTSTCAILKQALKPASIALETSDVKGESFMQADGRVRIRLNFPDSVTSVEVQGQEGSPLKVDQVLIQDHIYQAVITPENAVTLGQEIPLNIRSSLGCYRWSMRVENTPWIPLSVPLSLWQILGNGILFFIFSPLWSFWLKPTVLAKSPAKFHRSILKLQVLTLAAIITLGILWFCGISWNVILVSSWALPIVLGIGLYGLYHPCPRLWIFVLFFLLWPRPLTGWFEPVSVARQCGLLVWCAICSILPFNFWILDTNSVLKVFKKIQKEQSIAYALTVRLPYLILILWLGGTAIGYALIEKDPALPKTDIKGPAIVRVTSPTCTTCLQERLSFFSRIKTDKIHLYQTGVNSSFAKKKRHENQLKQENFSVLITQDGKEVILSPGMELKEFYQILEQYF